MNKISAEEIQKIATMSALSLSDDSAATLGSELNDILGYVQQLEAVDTDGAEPTYQLTGLSNVTRPDELVDYKVSNEALLQNAPSLKDNQIVVPKVL